MWFKKITRKALLTHIFFFTFFLIIPTLVFERLPEESIFSVTRVIVQDTIANFILLCFFYLNYYVLIPKFYFENRYVLYVFSVIVFLIFTLPLPNLIGDWMPALHHDLPPLNQPPNGFPQPDHHLPGNGLPDHQPLFFFSFNEFRRHLYLFFTAVFFSFLLRTREHLFQAKEEKLSAELSSLKSQINPHFLFNTLNNIYALSIKKDDRASEAIIHLSGIMRYAIKDANDAKIPLQKEIDYIVNYIELQKSRIGNTATVKFACFGNADGKEIAPLLLITYIENAFKYGINPDVENCTVEIKLRVMNAEVELSTFNRKIQRAQQAESTGIGMNNTKERLTHLYAGRHKLTIHDEKDTYSVTLSIDLA